MEMRWRDCVNRACRCRIINDGTEPVCASAAVNLPDPGCVCRYPRESGSGVRSDYCPQDDEYMQNGCFCNRRYRKYSDR